MHHFDNCFVFTYTVGKTLTPEMARTAVAQCTDTIVESNIDPYILARKAYSKEIISEDVYKVVRDKKTGDTSAERIEKILDGLRDRIKRDPNVLNIFLDILRDNTLSQNALADSIKSKLI